MIRNIQLFCLLTLFYTGAAFAQVAYVYVQTPKGTYAYDSSSAGKLTAIKGSPFTETSGLIVGTNGKFFITVGTDYVYSYIVASDGTIGKQVSEINTQSYGGSECGTTNGAVLDHTGEYVYVLLDGLVVPGSDTGDARAARVMPRPEEYNPPPQLLCNTFQTLAISKSGLLTFKGDTVFNATYNTPSLPTVAGNGKFAYDIDGYICLFCIDPYFLNAFTRESSGTLDNSVMSEVDPTPEPGGWTYLPIGPITDDSTTHLAIALIPEYDEEGQGPFGSIQLASYTVSTIGQLISTNTYENMPTITGAVYGMKMSPSGKLLAVATGTGIQMFHFNGGSPITEFTGIIGVSGSISKMQWDTDNHLYALNTSGKLHVYTATTTSVKEVAGSPYVIPDGTAATGVIVRSN